MEEVLQETYTHEKIIAVLIIIIVVLGGVIFAIGVNWPQPSPDGTLTYKGWIIYPPSNSTSAWTATKNGNSPLSDRGLAEILATIDGE